jgi:hypothetical protein
MNFLAHQSKAIANLLAGAGAQQQQSNPYTKKAGGNAQQQTAADEGSESDPQGDEAAHKGDPLHEDDLQDEGFEIAEEITQVLYHAQAHIGGRPHPEVVVEVRSTFKHSYDLIHSHNVANAATILLLTCMYSLVSCLYCPTTEQHTVQRQVPTHVVQAQHPSSCD